MQPGLDRAQNTNVPTNHETHQNHVDSQHAGNFDHPKTGDNKLMVAIKIATNDNYQKIVSQLHNVVRDECKAHDKKMT